MFLKVIAEHAPSEQFEARRDLWWSYFNREYVTDACVILGRDAARTAERIKEKHQLMYGEFLRGGVQADQSVLLMSVGKLIVADWSHNGKFRAWDQDGGYKPKFHQKYYDANDLRKDSNEILQVNGDYGDGIVHHRQGNWVHRVERYISKEAGINTMGSRKGSKRILFPWEKENDVDDIEDRERTAINTSDPGKDSNQAPGATGGDDDGDARPMDWVKGLGYHIKEGIGRWRRSG